MLSNYKDKYLKYKNKYLKLKMLGGGKFSNALNSFIKDKKTECGVLNYMFNKPSNNFKIEDHKNEMETILSMIDELYVRMPLGVEIPFLKWIGKYLENPEIIDYLKAPKFCSLEELMTFKNPERECSNVEGVYGGCGSPHFNAGNNDIDESQKDKWITIIDIITEKFKNESSPKYLDLVLGATRRYEPAFDNKDSFTLNINPTNIEFDEYDSFIAKLKELPKMKNEILKFKGSFPLTHNYPKSLEILNKLIKIHHNGIIVRITNRMCGTCHRSLYYLVKNYIFYEVAPEQGLGVQDTPEIRKCFK